MKNTFIFTISLLSLSCFATAQQKIKNQFILQGTVRNQSQGWVYLSYTDKNGNYVQDSTALRNGSFQFKGYITEPTMAMFNGNIKSRSMNDPNLTSFYLEPGVIKISVIQSAFKKAKITGSKTQQQYEALQKPLSKINDRWKVVMDTLSAVNARSNVQFQELKNWVLLPYEAEVYEVYKSYLSNYPSSYVSPVALFSLVGTLTTDSLAMYYNRFSGGVKSTTYGKMIKEELQRRKMGVPGTVAANFTTTDINGNTMSLSDYKGRYVLLDFWASWCVPCRKGNPHLLSIYSMYKDKGFEIISVSDDDSKPEAWRKAVEQDKIGVWKHVLRGYDMNKRMKGEKNENDIAEKYGIASLPTRILVGPDGIIIGRYTERDEDVEALDKKLAEIYGNMKQK